MNNEMKQSTQGQRPSSTIQELANVWKDIPIIETHKGICEDGMQCSRCAAIRFAKHLDAWNNRVTPVGSTTESPLPARWNENLAMVLSFLSGDLTYNSRAEARKIVQKMLGY